MANAPDLKRLISAVLEPKPPYNSTKEFITLCHQIALAYLKTKTFGHRFLPEKFGLSVNDLAYDAIADLFRRNEEGEFVELSRYFNHDVPLDSRSDEGLLTDTRRLVLSVVNRRIFRLYRASDPSLSKLIRNIKLTLRGHKSLMYESRAGETVITVRKKSERRENLPVLPPEFILPELLARAPRGASVKEIVNVFAAILTEEREYRGMIPLVGLAMTARAFYASGVEISGSEVPPSSFSHDEMVSLARNVVLKLKAGTAGDYVRKKKLDSRQLHHYLVSVYDILLHEFDGADSTTSSYFEIFKSHYGPLTELDYKAGHRVVLEYFAKLAKADMKKELKKELQIP